jgi:hypothetical protein
MCTASTDCVENDLHAYTSAEARRQKAIAPIHPSLATENGRGSWDQRAQRYGHGRLDRQSLPGG